MDSRTEEILNAFPGLRYDSGFRITSPSNPDYNCIAWAFGKDNCWMWPEEDADGVIVWPERCPEQATIQVFISAFNRIGYEKCENADLEDGYLKVALYCLPDSDECTHAASQLKSGLWTSKLGESNDIQHSTPYTIQGRYYGNVVCVLRRSTASNNKG